MRDPLNSLCVMSPSALTSTKLSARWSCSRLKKDAAANAASDWEKEDDEGEEEEDMGLRRRRDLERLLIFCLEICWKRAPPTAFYVSCLAW